MSDTLDIILNAMPWDDHGVHVAFDRQGRGTILSEVDDRYVRIEAKQVSGIATSKLVNGLVVTLYSCVTGELDRQAFHFGHHGIAAELSGSEQRNGLTTYYWKAAYGSSRYEGDPIDGTELVEAVAGFMATVGMLHTSPRKAAEKVTELDPLSTLVIQIGDGVDWDILSSMLNGVNVTLHLIDGDTAAVRATGIDRIDPEGFEGITGYVLDDQTWDDPGPTDTLRVWPIGEIVMVEL